MREINYFKKKGDVYIFMSSVGLILSLGMVAFMIVVILVKALGFFWPSELIQLTLNDHRKYLGEKYATTTAHSVDSTGIRIEKPQTQLKIGNRDLYGMDFIWLDDHSILQTEKPKYATAFERQEYGVFFGRIKSVHQADGKIITGDQDRIYETVRKAHRIARENRDNIFDLEDKQNKLMKPLTDLNREISLFEISEQARTEAGKKKLEALYDRADQLELSLAEDFRKTSADVQKLRQANQKIYVRVTTADDREKEIYLADVVRFYQPNRMSVPAKSVHYLAKVGEFIFGQPRESNTEGGVFPAIFGTVMMVVIMSIAVVPFGVMAAIYLNEYAKQGPVVRIIRLSVNNLAGVPSIVLGVFGLGFFIYMVGGTIDQLFFSQKLPEPTFGTGGIFWASLTLALLTVPVVVVATEEGLLAVPRANKDGALALGATKWQMIRRVVLPNAMPGILTGLILAISRGAGEVAPLMITGVVKLAPTLPLDASFPFLHLDRKFMHLGFHIYDVGFQSPNVEAAKPMVYTTALLLILIVVLLNLLAIFIRNYLRKKYKSSTF